jgi:hypothetical protein
MVSGTSNFRVTATGRNFLGLNETPWQFRSLLRSGSVPSSIDSTLLRLALRGRDLQRRQNVALEHNHRANNVHDAAARERFAKSSYFRLTYATGAIQASDSTAINGLLRPSGLSDGWSSKVGIVGCVCGKPNEAEAILGFICSWAALPIRQLFRSLRSFDYSFDQSHAQLSFFQLQDAVDGASRRGCDRVFQQSWMIAGL